MGWEGSWSFKPKSSFCFCQELNIWFIFNHAFEYVVWALRRKRRGTMVMVIRLFLPYSVVWVELAGRLWICPFFLISWHIGKSQAGATERRGGTARASGSLGTRPFLSYFHLWIKCSSSILPAEIAAGDACVAPCSVIQRCSKLGELIWVKKEM